MRKCTAKTRREKVLQSCLPTFPIKSDVAKVNLGPCIPLNSLFNLQVEAVVRQRDMYRVLLATNGQSPVGRFRISFR